MAECMGHCTTLRQASFRDVEFERFRYEDTFGQRGPTHAYSIRQMRLVERD